jgi:hypothetical protein
MPRIPMRVQYPYLHGTEWVHQQIQMLDERRVLGWVRHGRELCYDDEPTPMVTVRVATYGRGRTVVDRAVRSALEQNYENIEVLVVGDCCDDDTVEAMAEVNDERVRFVNLAQRGWYPPLAHHRRKVAGAHPMNVGNVLARGAWIAPCDDDDEITPDHIDVLLAACRERRLEMVYSKAEDETFPGVWTSVGREPLARGDVSHGSVMFRSELRFMPYSLTCWKMKEPGDWNLWKRMERIGVKIGFVDHVTYRHYLSEAGRTRLGHDTSSPSDSVGSG